MCGLFVDCPHEKGCLVYAGIIKTDFSDYENSDEDSDEEKDDVEDEDCTEAYELCSESVLDIIQKDSIIALYSPSKSIELFFLFKEFGVAENTMVDRNEHYIMKGEKFIKENYLEKTKEKKGAVFYKITNTEAYVLPTEVMSLVVTMDDNLSIPIAEYSWLSGCIGIPNF